MKQYRFNGKYSKCLYGIDEKMEKVAGNTLPNYPQSCASQRIRTSLPTNRKRLFMPFIISLTHYCFPSLSTTSLPPTISHINSPYYGLLLIFQAYFISWGPITLKTWICILSTMFKKCIYDTSKCKTCILCIRIVYPF